MEGLTFTSEDAVLLAAVFWGQPTSFSRDDLSLGYICNIFRFENLQGQTTGSTEAGMQLLFLRPQGWHAFYMQGGRGVAVEEVTPIRRHSLNIYYGTQTGTAEVFAKQLASTAEARGVTVAVYDLKDCDPEDTLTQEVSQGAAALWKLC